MSAEQILRKHGITDPDIIEKLDGLAEYIADAVYQHIEYLVRLEIDKGEASEEHAEALYELVKHYLREKLED